MKNLNGRALLQVLFFALLLWSCTSQKPTQTTREEDSSTPKPQPKSAKPKPVIKLQLPEVDREFRGAWIATVANINWPSRNNLSMAQQKAEAIELLDLLQRNNFNAVIFQARPSADAFYRSSLEPWSYFLTGTTGRDPGYDPLDFWIKEAHKRGMELHAWINPYRAYHTTGGPITSESMVRKMPNETVKLRNGTYWFDPANTKTQDHVSEVIKDLVKRYDLDGIHLDDYFYPYKEYNSGRDFPDDSSWNAYLKQGGTLPKADWRRANVNQFVKRIYDEIKAEKSFVKFGISPFGIWKSGYPADVRGSSQYDELYADAKLWLNQGWIDYFSPQLYWKINGPQNFNSLLSWWNDENIKKRHLWPGLNTVGVRGVVDRPAEIVGQVNSIRQHLPNSKGEIHYSVAGLTNDYKMQEVLINGPYKRKALVPKSFWLKADTLEAPKLDFRNVNASEIIATWSHPNENRVFHWLLYTQYGGKWEAEILNSGDRMRSIQKNKNGQSLTGIAVRAVDRLSNESNYSFVEIK